MNSLTDKVISVVESGLVLRLSHFFITLILLFFTILVVYRIFQTIEARKISSKRLLNEENISDISWLPERSKIWIQKQEKIINTPVLPIITRYFLLGMLSMLVIPLLSLITGRNSPIFIVASIFIGLIIMYMPFAMINGMTKNKQNLLNLELPEYLESFALLRQQQTLFEATLNSIEFAGPNLKPYVEQLILDVQLKPGSIEPYKDFARKINNVDVETFMNTMIETTNVDQKLGSELIAEELNQVSKMRSDVYVSVIEEIEAKVGTRNLLLSIPIILIILVFMFYTIVKIVQDSGIM